MLFDEKYSETISLSKILDCFITDGEEPSVIINFLKQYSVSETFEILSNSFCVSRILSISFLYRCSVSERFFILELLKKIDLINGDFSLMRIFQYFIWQILRSDFIESDKRIARKSMNILEEILEKKYIRTVHPYKGPIGKEMSEYDYIFFKHVEDENCIINTLSEIDIFDFTSYMGHIEKSLWFPRIMQLDVFENLEIQRQYVFLNNVFASYTNEDRTLLNRFAKQILGSGVDVHVKDMVFEKISSFGFACGRDDSDSVKMIRESSCYEELIMNMTLYGLDNLAEDIIMYFVIFGDKDMLKKMYENNKEILEEYLDMTDLIGYWIENEKR